MSYDCISENARHRQNFGKICLKAISDTFLNIRSVIRSGMMGLNVLMVVCVYPTEEGSSKFLAYARSPHPNFVP